MMKKISKQTLTLIGAGFMCFFSLFAVCAAALAWFYEGRTVGSTQTVRGHYDDIHAKFYVYKFTKDFNGNATDLDLEEEGTPKLDLANFKLNTYDTIFVHQNAYTAALVRIHIYGENLPSATQQNPKTVSVEITRDTSLVDPDADDPNDETTYKFISSGADFTLGMLSDYNDYTSYDDDYDLDNIKDVTDFMKHADAYFKVGIYGDEEHNIEPTMTPSCFAVIDENEGNSKHDSITIGLQYTSTTVIDGINHLNVLLYINYNEDLIEQFIINEDFTEINGLGANDVLLSNDLEDIFVSVE